jgi:beta-lactam-binding protein with PASTA domain
VVGQRRADAIRHLQAAGFAVQVFPVECGSALPAGRVAYQQPPRAALHATVTICVSSSNRLTVRRPPPPPPPAPPLHHQPPVRPQPPPRHHHGHGHPGH